MRSVLVLAFMSLLVGLAHSESNNDQDFNLVVLHPVSQNIQYYNGMVEASEILDKIIKGEPVEYDHVIVKGDLNFSGLGQPRLASQNDHIERTTKEIGYIFIGSSEKDKSKLSEYQANISSYIRISYSKIEGSVYLNNTLLREAIDFKYSKFNHPANFRGATFNNYDADFWNAIFNSDADFTGSTFIGWATYINSAFNGDADFTGSIFNDYVVFNNASFNRNSSFKRATFRDDANFMDSAFNGDANFMDSAFDADANFMDSAFDADANFMDSTFSNSATFNGTQFSGRLDFVNGRLNSSNFIEALFKRPAYFENATFSNLNLARAEYNHLYLSWGNIKNFDFDEGAYLALIKNYKDLGWYDDANECYYDYRNAVRKNWFANSASSNVFKTSLNWIIDTGEWLFYGYGVKPSFPLLCSGLHP